jgi:hypothetical protein
MHDRGYAVSREQAMADFRTRCACYHNEGNTTEGEIQMPTKVNLELIIVWACVGFFTGAGWAVATWLVGRILALTHL